MIYAPNTIPALDAVMTLQFHVTAHSRGASEFLSSGVAMFDWFTFWLVVLAVLIACLCLSVWLRLRAEDSRRRARERQNVGKGFDASTIAPQIQRVRQNYLVSAHQRSRSASFRAGFFAAARKMVTSFSYFRRRGHEHEPQKHDA